MSKENSTGLFNNIASIYGLFFEAQRSSFTEAIKKGSEKLDITTYRTILDVGCGTGALCSVLDDKGLQVTGIDPAEKMLAVAIKKLSGRKVILLQADATDRIPFDDNSFDVVIASHVAHGMDREKRKQMYREMSRVARQRVIIHDYNEKRSLLTSIIEWAEGGDYFRFIKEAEQEMNSCLAEMKKCFSEVEVINVAPRAAWYICTPKDG